LEIFEKLAVRSKLLFEYCWKMTVTLSTIMSQEFIGEMGEFITFLCRVFWVLFTKKNTKIGYGLLII